jgi:hypothetical protein
MMLRAVAARCAIAALLAAVAVGACQGRKRQGDGAGGGGDEPVGSGSGSGVAEPSLGEPDLTGAGVAGAGSNAAGAGSAGKVVAPDEPEPPADPNKQIAELGAIPAWQAVVDRAQLLARRGQKGVVYGRIGPAILVPAPAPDPADGGVPADGGGMVASPYVWLVDDTEGSGSLGIRLALGKITASEGDRVAASGAWELDAERRWYWKVGALQPLAAPPPPTSSSLSSSSSGSGAPTDTPYAAPSHVPPPAALPPTAKPIKQAKDNDIVYFQLVGPTPARDGDGWLIGTQLYDVPIALLLLPGERPSYGGHDLRSPDERWQLRRQTIYWLRIGKLRSQGPGQPYLVNARTPPVRVQ